MVSYVVMKAGGDFYLWHTLIALLYAGSMYRLIHRYSANIYISIMCLFCLGQFNFVLGGLRQTIAISILANAYALLREKRLFRFLLIVALASLFHSSAVVFIIAYPLYRLRLRPRNLLLVSAAGVLCVLNASTLMRLYLKFFSQEDVYSGYLESETTLSIAGMVISGCIALFCIVFTLSDKKNAEHAGLCYFTLVSFFVKMLSTFMFADVFRVALYFSVFDCILIAEACTCNQDRMLKQLKTVGVSLAMTVYYFIPPPAAYIESYVMR